MLLLAACVGGRTSYGISLMGEPLVNPPLASTVHAGLFQDLVEAREAFDERPADEEAAIWVGRRLGYLAQYPEAIAHYTRALEQHPESYRLLRHRGHRYITTRRLAEAVADLSRAEEFAEGQLNAVEPDGAPNPAGIPIGTDRGNILYHLGLAQYLLGDFESAQGTFAWRARIDGNADNRASTAYWRFLSLARLGRMDEALGATAGVREGDELLENFAYHELVLLFRGERTEAQLEERLAGLSGSSAHALAYGIGAWHWVEGREAEALDRWRAIVADDTRMDAFGFIATEAELARR